MWNVNRTWIGLLMAGLVAACVGCQNSDGSGGPNGQPDAESPAQITSDPGGEGGNVAQVNQTPSPPPPPTIPEVKLTDEHRATCLAWIGDSMPEAELPALDGQSYQLGALRGGQVTIVCFWTSGTTPYGRLRTVGMLEDLARDYGEPFAEKGVRVIGIYEGDAAELARREVEEAKVQFPILLDPGGNYFARVATQKLPRIYVVDSQAKIRWLDTEYSEITRENLRQTVEVLLGED